MSDDDASTSRTVRRERALAAARRRLKRLEIETHRIKAELARLEAENEDDIADELSGELHDDAAIDAKTGAAGGSPTADRPRRPRTLPRDASGGATDSSPASDPSLETQSWRADRTARLRRRSTKRPTATGPRIEIDTTHDAAAEPTGGRALARKARRQTMPALWSLVLHAAVLLVCLPWTFAALTNENVPLMASSLDLSVDPLDDAAETPIELANDQELQLQDVALEETALDLAESLTGDLTPLEDTSAAELASTIGQLDSLPSDLGTLMAGAGSGGDGGGQLAGAGQLGMAAFFGTQSRGNRFVFLVDNSSSMKDGRLEAALAELQRSVGAMSRRQSFYVIFVSDQTYPMFYPQQEPQLLPATEPNKQRLREWLTNVTLAGGKNRELISAMDLAASLRPDAVFFLWDGHLPHEGVRRDVMTYLTRPNQWSFVIHTLGMGVESLDAEQHLAAIAQVHGGTYRPIPVRDPRARAGGPR